MEKAINASERVAPATLEEALALLARREAELAALRSTQQEWVHAVSHDLRAPLRHVLAFNPLIGELLQQPNMSAEDLQEANGFLQIMEQSTQRMAAMLDGLLQLSRLSAHVVQRQAVDIADLLQRVKARSQSQWAHRPIEWVLPQQGFMMHADPLLLEHALEAALSNAIKFTRPVAQASIQVEVSRRDNAEVHISIRDNGVGFDAARATRLFGIFQRMHRDAEFEGVGTGLTLVRQICRQHGGDAHIHAEPGQGCQLVMHWPQGL